MRQRLFIFGTIALVAALLVALNAATYVKIEPEPDTEWKPDRSTFNAGATGTRGLYDFLNESGYQVTRWRETATLLTKDGAAKPSTFVIVGPVQEQFKEDEQKALLAWVKAGGRLVLIDRRPSWKLLPEAGLTQVSIELKQFPTADARPDNPDAMTEGVAVAKPMQITPLTRRVETVQPSRFASRILLLPAATPTPTPKVPPTPPKKPMAREKSDAGEDTLPLIVSAPPPKPANPPPPVAAVKSSAPVIHLADEKEGALAVDYAHGQGRIVLLSDPFIVANGGLRRADNLQLAVNLVASGGGLIAFDEFHQGHGKPQNPVFAYFTGTPILALLAQGGLLVGLLAWARGRRWGRPLPLPQVDRRSQLEFVASLAELQNRARAYDLALENIYSRARRALARYAGLSADSPHAAIAEQVAARSKLDAKELESLMRECQNHINGEPLNAKKALDLAARLREVESRLGLSQFTVGSRR